MLGPDDTDERSFATPAFGAAYGLIAGVSMVVATVAARVIWGSITVTELAADWFTETIPPEAIDFLLSLLSTTAKPLMFAGLLVAQVVVGVGLGAGYAWQAQHRPLSGVREWGRVAGLSAALWLVSMVTIVPLFGGGFLGLSVRGGTLSFLVISLATYLVYGLALGYMLKRPARRPSDVPYEPTRRSFLRQAAIWGAILVVAGGGGTLLVNRLRARLTPSGTFRTQGVLSTEVTPNDEFYIVSKNIIDPEVDVTGWSLEVAGLVDRPFTLTYDELRAMPAVEEYVTLECISNEVGGDLISNAYWKGVPLRHIIEEAGVQLGVVDVSFEADDDYSESITLDRALNRDVMVAYEMNGEPLPFKHGFPARLIIPGFFGLKHVKWLTKIAPVDEDFQGYWQRRGWTDNPILKTMSKFETPHLGSRHPVGPLEIGGVAFAGDRGISKIEISPDKGRSWREVDQMSEPLSEYTWVVWRTLYTPNDLGNVTFHVRATDGAGMRQDATPRPTLPDGATGIHKRVLIFDEIAKEEGA